MNVLRVENLYVEVGTTEKPTKAVQGVSFSLSEGETFAIVGESGSGKSMLCKSIMHLLPKSGQITDGSIWLMDEDITHLKEKEMCAYRGSQFAMVFQDPMTSLDPTFTIGKQIAEAVLLHNPKMERDELRERVIWLMELVGIENAKERMQLYPYNLSGGMRQRCVLAIALASNPKILIADEPTTALDVTIQAQILSLLKEIQKKLHTAIIFVSHDLAVVAQIADRVAIMHEGKIVETGEVREVFQNPQDPYTRHLLNDRPSAMAKHSDHVHEEKKGHSHAHEHGYAHEDMGDHLLEVRGLTHIFPLTKRSYVKAVDDVSFALHRGEILGIVGESGSGKSTLARCIMNIYPSSAGEIVFDGVHTENRMDYRKHRQILQTRRQMIFQDSYSSLDPRMKVVDVITEPLRIHRVKPKRGSYREEAAYQLKFVGLEEEFLDKYPPELSGGQRQRVAIARALTMEPDLLIADEAVASLDVTTQAGIIQLFKHLREEHGISILFIAHDLMLVKSICDRVGVMKQGKLVELAATQELFTCPQHGYTKELLAAVPQIDTK